MAGQGNTITKTEQINYFTTNFRNVVRDQTIWFSGSSNPGTGFFDVYTFGGGKDPGGPSTGNLADNVGAATLRNLFHLWARDYTAHRRHRFVRSGNTPGATDQTQIQHFPDGNRFTGGDSTINNTGFVYDIEHTFAISAANFNNFVNNLRSQWDSYKLNTLTTSVNYCHSSCHSSCHSAGRGRR